MTWEQGRQLATAKRNTSTSTKTIAYDYDMAGVRSGKTVTTKNKSTGETTMVEYKYTTLSGLLTRMTYGTTAMDFVYDESNQPLAVKYTNLSTGSSAKYYYVVNAQGDVVGLTNSAGDLVIEYVYDPWGSLLETKIGVDESNSKYSVYNNMALRNPLRYRGYIYERDTGFYYLQSRYYDPATGRFINADSYASTDATGLLSTNMFAYCENDPVNRSDPSGEIYLEVLLTGAAIGVFRQFATDVIGNAIAGRPLDQLSSVGTYAAAAISGMVEVIPGGGVTAAAVDILFSPIIQETIDVAVYGDRAKYDDIANGVAKSGTAKGISIFANEKADKIEEAARKQYGTKKKLMRFTAKAVKTIGNHVSSIVSFVKAALA